jgi:DNA-binding CsgD family transcriptional regulator
MPRSLRSRARLRRLRASLEVARLVAAGLRNREIAGRLSVRTAESHVERIRLKLGLHSRAEIARWIAQCDVLDAMGRTLPSGLA